ncbi:MAG: DUF2505 family protein [bacterium]
MKFESSQVIDFPVERVFTVVRDHLAELVPFMPNVDKIEIRSREPIDGGRIRIVNRWYGRAEVPAIAARFIPPEMVGWVDTAVWDESRYSCQWQIEPLFMRESVSCTGVNDYRREEAGRKTRLQITGDLSVRSKGLPGVPRLLERKVAEQIEKFVVRLLAPNLDRLARGVNDYLTKVQGNSG